MKHTSWIITGYDKHYEPIERKVTFKAEYIPPGKSCGETIGHHEIEDVQFVDTGKDVPDILCEACMELFRTVAENEELEHTEAAWDRHWDEKREV